MTANMEQPYAERSSLTFRAVEATLRTLCRYHDYRAYGLSNIPRQGGGLIAFHHSLATYDSFLLGAPLADELGREFRGLADRLIFRTPGLAHVFHEAGFRLGTRENTHELLARGELIGLAPGGMAEGLRSSRDKYRFDWSRRRGFVWVAMEAGVPIVLAACPHADDLYDVYPNPLTPLVYERFRFPAPLFRGLGPTALPRPVHLYHLVSEPLYPDVAPDRVTQRDVDAMHARVCSRMERLMKDALELDGSRRVPNAREQAPMPVS